MSGFTPSRPALDDITRAAANDYFATGNYAAYLAATGKSQPTTGTKRKAETTAPNLGSDPEDYDDYLDGQPIDKSCNQVRGMIRRFLESEEMKKGEFCEAIGVGPSNLNNFLGQNGSMQGAGSDSYGNVWAFFKKREWAGKVPKKARTSATATASSTKQPAVHISGISLPGEEHGRVPVYDSCDETRKKINAHLVKPGVTAAQFCRDLEAQAGTGQKIQSKQLTDFRSKKGPRSGNTSIVFYTAYGFFEKMRLAKLGHLTDSSADCCAPWALVSWNTALVAFPGGKLKDFFCMLANFWLPDSGACKLSSCLSSLVLYSNVRCPSLLIMRVASTSYASP